MAEDIPAELRYTEEHEWVRDDGDLITIGITAFAQDQLGDVVYVDLPAPGSMLEGGQVLGEVESTKSVSDLFSPVSGEVAERNDELDEHPEQVNNDPYGAGWLLTVRPRDRADLDQLLDADGYAKVVSG
ncbi:MAG: glycine cleavage system protein GcvH [Nitriliruptoraceae bacterium]